MILLGAVLMVMGYFMPLFPQRLYQYDQNIFSLASQRATNGLSFPVLYTLIDLAIAGMAIALMSVPAAGIGFYEQTKTQLFLRKVKKHFDNCGSGFVAEQAQFSALWIALTVFFLFSGLTLLLLGYFVPAGTNRLFQANTNLFTLAVLPYNPFDTEAPNVEHLIKIAIAGFSFFVIALPCFFFYGSETSKEYRITV